MKFEKNVLFLGMTENRLRDGTKYFSISLYEPDSGPVTVNVMQGHNMLSRLAGCQFGERLDVVFVLRPKDRLYRLTLA